jgi:hypothetical protein
MSTMAEATEFDMYAQEPPNSEWDYVIDELGIAYRRGLVAQRLRPGWWPLAYADPEREHRARRRDYPPVAPECGAAGVRLAPDCKLYAWRNETVVVGPDHKVPHVAHASAYLWAGDRRILRCRLQLDLKAQTYTLGELPEDTRPEIRAQGESKGAKLVSFFAAACEARDGSEARPVTAWDLEEGRKARRVELIRAYCAEHGLPFRRPEYSDDHFVIAGERLSIIQVAVKYLPDLFAG